MGMFGEMFGNEDNGEELIASTPEPEILGYGEFTYNAEDVLTGYRFFRKRYIIKQTILRLVLVTIALASSIFMLITDGASPITVACTTLCVLVAGWFIKTPIDNKKKTSEAVKELEGENYAVEFTADTAKIMLSGENEDIEENAGTLIHLDQYIVDILDTKTLYIIVAAKRYVFVIPKSAFDDDTNTKIKDTLRYRMETRYKTIEE
ncbi:MAG: hypothetical protein LBM41_07760 [Ruminococcus sp.]|jgi:hypothetical protein|nr:hypothetical protein [Ruminococcus sp.]